MNAVAEVTTRTAVVIAVLAGSLAVGLGAVALALAPSDDCPPLGNGGAMRVADTGERVDSRARARTLLRSRVGDGANVAGAGAGHPYGSRQIHRHVGGVDHYHFAATPGDGSSTVGWVVTANGTVYRVVQGAC